MILRVGTLLIGKSDARVVGFHIDDESCSGHLGVPHLDNTTTLERQSCERFLARLARVSARAANLRGRAGSRGSHRTPST
jgi:hypothetical protein